MKYLRRFESLAQRQRSVKAIGERPTYPKFTDEEIAEIKSILEDIMDEFSMSLVTQESEFVDNNLSLWITNTKVGYGLYIVIGKYTDWEIGLEGDESEEAVKEIEAKQKEESIKIRDYWIDYIAPRIESLGYKINVLYQNMDRYIEAVIYRPKSNQAHEAS